MHLPLPEPPRDEFFTQMSSARDPAPALAHHHHHHHEYLDDVFGPDPDPDPDPASQQQQQQPATTEISLDSRRLRAQHATEGYREGVTAGKAGRLQAGFDEAFGLGASIGLAAGRLRGLLEGLAAALRNSSSTPPSSSSSRRADQLLRDGARELSTRVIFGGEYWDADGSWKYPVAGDDGDGGGGGGEVVFEHVAGEHPVVRKWTRIVERELRRWDVDPSLCILDRGSSQQQQQEEEEEGEAGAKPVKAEVPPTRAIDW